MTSLVWQHPFALLGALSIVLPIAIHLLGRGHARVYRFPTLRFFRTSRLLPTRRTRIHDPWLLALRAAILIAAAAALAQPLFARSGRRAEVQRRLVRAVIIDSSASMRSTADSILRIANHAATASDESVVIRTATPSAALRSASEWLQRRAGRREIVVVSNFPRASLEGINEVPAGVGLRFVRVPFTPAKDIDRGSLHVAIAGPTVTATWGSSVAATAPIRLLTSDAERADADLALDAARSIAGTYGFDTTHAVSIVLPGYPKRDALLNGPLPRQPWMIDVLARLLSPYIARQSDSSANAAIVLFCSAPAASLSCATLTADVLRASTMLPTLDQYAFETVPDSTLARLERAPAAGTDVGRSRDWLTGPSDGRWLWALALLLIAAEALVRRDRVRRTDTLNAPAHDLAA
jgi:hypothetical protein